MKINDVLKKTGLTRKAVEYYIGQGLIFPQAQENGYRSFTAQDVSCLEQIAAYRKLGVGIADIRRILGGEKKQVIGQILLRQSLAAQREEKRRELLASLAGGAPLDGLFARIDALDAQQSIAEKLLFAFPGTFGRYFALHFSHFLQSPIETEEQRRALDAVTAWLDGLAPIEFPEDVRRLLDDAEPALDAHAMEEMHAAVIALSEDPAAYLKANETAIRAAMEMHRTQAYQQSPAAHLAEAMKAFQQQSGYTQVFLPAMERLSPAYADYRRRLQEADGVFAKVFGTENN